MVYQKRLGWPNDNTVEYVRLLVVGLVDEKLGSKPPLSEAEKKMQQF